MLYWDLVFLIVAIAAAIFGFTGIAAETAAVAPVLFWIFVVVFVVALAIGLIGRGHGPKVS